MGSVRALSVLPHELPAAVEKLQQEGKDLRKANARLMEQLAVHEADRLFASTPERGGRRTIVEVVDGFDPPSLKAMAVALAARGATFAALVSSARPPFVVIARSPDVTADANVLLRQLIAEHGGKGGGKADLAQGGGMDADPMTLVAALRRLVTV
jgi:alanyl-tRNA synthetase